MHIQFETITPGKAAEILRFSQANGFTNREESRASIKKYSTDMKEGRWQTTGDSIKITSEGILIDGYHRLKAVIESGVPLFCAVAMGIQKKSYEVIDSGKRRTVADTLYVDGYKNYTKYLPEAARALYYFINKKQYPQSRQSSPKDLGLEIVRFVLDIYGDEMTEAACYYASHKGLVTSSVHIVLCTCFNQVDKALAYDFYERIHIGDNMEKDDPRLRVRNILLSHRRSRTTKIERSYEAALIVMAWNYFIQNKKIKKISVPQKAFPIIHGLDYDKFFDSFSAKKLARKKLQERM